MSGANVIPVQNHRSSRFDDAGAHQEERGRSMFPKSRWGLEDQKVNIPGLPTTLPTNLTQAQVDSFMIAIRLEEVNRKLKSGDVLPKHDRRSVSPDPIYGPGGNRINTREARYKEKLESERQQLVEMGIEKIPGFKPPSDIKKQTKLSDKIYIPIQDFPQVNFMGMLIGPRGKSLKQIEADSGAKISIRGRGSVKEGRGNSVPGADEDLHCLILADTEEQLTKASQIVNQIIETATSVPDGQNDLKKMQLRELAALNGTLREDDQLVCMNCGELGHKRYDCPAMKNVTNTIICRVCGGAGHIAADCTQKNDPEALAEARKRNAIMDNEYANLMAEIGQGDVIQMNKRPTPWEEKSFQNNPIAMNENNENAPAPWAEKKEDAPPPWAEKKASGPAPWAKKDDAPAPWASRSDRHHQNNNTNNRTRSPQRHSRYQNNRNHHENNQRTPTSPRKDMHRKSFSRFPKQPPVNTFNAAPAPTWQQSPYGPPPPGSASSNNFVAPPPPGMASAPPGTAAHYPGSHSAAPGYPAYTQQNMPPGYDTSYYYGAGYDAYGGYTQQAPAPPGVSAPGAPGTTQPWDLRPPGQ